MKAKQERLMKRVKRELMTTEQQEIENITRNDPLLSQIQMLFHQGNEPMN